ncbi:RNA-binding protein MEX3B isoform X2 [Drosophila takahashii]|uniref:RNA-binding protein MEX3B isoform X2 n=1 Tax=Drosophila takahashii TaxID=29030 RepID=UPI003899350D
MSAAHISTEFSGFNRVSSSSASSSISSFNFSSASVSPSSSSLRESGAAPVLISLQKRAKCAVVMSAQVTPKILASINSKESIHKSNAVHHLDMADQGKVNASSLPLSDDPRTLQLALELSLVGFNDNQTCYAPPAQPLSLPLTAQSDFEMGTINGIPPFSKTDTTLPLTPAPSSLLLPTAGTVSLEDRSKKSQNMTECVPVPSSEHVAEIVGRQGCKIKALRAKTNTYIKTPVRGEEPVFVVTGRKEDVNKAKREILSAADHFSLIRASRKPISDGHSSGIVGNASGSGGGAVPRMQSGPPCMPGQVTIQDYASTTMKILGNGSNSVKPMHGHHSGNCFQKTEFSDMEIAATITPTGISDKHLPGNEVTMPIAKANVVFRNTPSKTLSFCPPTSTSASIHSNSNANILTRSCSSASSTTSTKSTNNSANTPPEILNIWKNISDSIDVDEGIGDSPSIWNQQANIIPTAHCSPTISISPTDSLLGLGEHSASQKNMHHTKDPTICNNQQKTQAIQLQPNPEKFMIHRECFVCNENDVTTALVPCGHNMFCMECANQICISMEAVCPVCNSIVYHAMRILG